MSKTTIGIIGTGRFATVLRNLFEMSPDVVVMQSSRSKQVDNQKIFSIEDVLHCDIVIAAIPISTFEEFLKHNSKIIKNSALFVDVCSVKTLPVLWMKTHLPKSIDILATHPLFGPTSTKHGTEFAGLKCVFSPIRIQDTQRFQVFQSLFASRGVSLHTMSPEDHDSLMARTQATSFLFGHLGHELQITSTDFDTAGFRSLLVNQSIVEADSHELLVDLFRFNPFAQDTLREAISHLTDFSEEIASEYYFYGQEGKG